MFFYCFYKSWMSDLYFYDGIIFIIGRWKIFSRLIINAKWFWMILNDFKFFSLPYCKMKYNKFGIKVIDLPGAVWIRKKFTKRSSTKEHLVKSMEERPEETNSVLSG